MPRPLVGVDGGDAFLHARTARRDWLQQLGLMNNANEAKFMQNSCACFFLCTSCSFLLLYCNCKWPDYFMKDTVFCLLCLFLCIPLSRHFSSLETSSVDLKLQHSAQKGLSL